MFVVISWRNTFPLFSYQAKSNDFTNNIAIFFQQFFLFWFYRIIWFKLYLLGFFSQLIRRFFDVPKYFIDSFNNIKVFIVRVKLTNTFLFYWFLSFYFTVKFFCWNDQFHQLLLRVCNHENINRSYNLTHDIVFACFLLHIKLFIFVRK